MRAMPKAGPGDGSAKCSLPTCNEPQVAVGVPFCVTHDSIWEDSPEYERARASGFDLAIARTAKADFVDRLDAEERSGTASPVVSRKTRGENVRSASAGSNP